MPTQVLTNAFIYLAGHDFTADSNEVKLTASGEVKDRTTFRPTTAGWRDKQIALKKIEMSTKGFWQSAISDAVDPEVFNNLGVTGRVLTVGGTETEGLPAYIMKSMPAKYDLLGKLGELAPFTLTGANTDAYGLIRGLLFKQWGTVSATGALGTGLQLGAVSATQRVYATFHVFGTPGTTITVVLESAAANTFASATTRATIGPLTTAGGTYITPVSGAITDTWWRFRVTAVTGTFTVAAAAAIQ